MNYIGDGDLKTYSGIVKAAPYVTDVTKKSMLDTSKKEWVLASDGRLLLWPVVSNVLPDVSW